MNRCNAHSLINLSFFCCAMDAMDAMDPKDPKDPKDPNIGLILTALALARQRNRVIFFLVKLHAVFFDPKLQETDLFMVVRDAAGNIMKVIIQDIAYFVWLLCHANLIRSENIDTFKRQCMAHGFSCPQLPSLHNGAARVQITSVDGGIAFPSDPSHMEGRVEAMRQHRQEVRQKPITLKRKRGNGDEGEGNDPVSDHLSKLRQMEGGEEGEEGANWKEIALEGGKLLARSGAPSPKRVRPSPPYVEEVTDPLVSPPYVEQVTEPLVPPHPIFDSPLDVYGSQTLGYFMTAPASPLPDQGMDGSPWVGDFFDSAGDFLA
jgi:hypothetical protein